MKTDNRSGNRHEGKYQEMESEIDRMRKNRIEEKTFRKKSELLRKQEKERKNCRISEW